MFNWLSDLRKLTNVELWLEFKKYDNEVKN